MSILLRTAAMTAIAIALAVPGIGQLRLLLQAQTPCPPVERVDYPVDTAAFRRVQGYGAPSPRHQGRYHTGEDWSGPRGESYGQPVRAIASGRVTYSFPLGWGRDGGVIILEHTLPDGAVLYSQYGHIMETDAVKFPVIDTCVEAGQVIAVIGDARPAPHLHFEIRVGDGADVPGPGYAWRYPDEDFWRAPSGFIERFRAARP
jgi:murein DD-endopeptidase MepM/ murein hydrolase activator NlpD